MSKQKKCLAKFIKGKCAGFGAYEFLLTINLSRDVAAINHRSLNRKDLVCKH